MHALETQATASMRCRTHLHPHLHGVGAQAACLRVEGELAQHRALPADHVHDVQLPRFARFNLRRHVSIVKMNHPKAMCGTSALRQAHHRVQGHLELGCLAPSCHIDGPRPIADSGPAAARDAEGSACRGKSQIL